jgi:hypothetical protein
MGEGRAGRTGQALLLALASAACTAMPGAVAVPSATNGPEIMTSAVPTAGPSIPADRTALLIKAARAYAASAGFELAPGGSPVVEDRQPDFDDLTLRLVGLPLAAQGDGAVLDLSFDDSNQIRVVSDGLAFSRATGSAVSRAEALVAAAAQFRLVGIESTSGALAVAKGEPGQTWYITLNRAIAGYPVANHPLVWGIAGDKAWATLRADGTLVYLYAIRPTSAPPAGIQPSGTLSARLASIAGLSESTLSALEPQLTWVRAEDLTTGQPAEVLTLNYCASRVRSDGWSAWCVDASTGEKSLEDSGTD